MVRAVVSGSSTFKDDTFQLVVDDKFDILLGFVVDVFLLNVFDRALEGLKLYFSDKDFVMVSFLNFGELDVVGTLL